MEEPLSIDKGCLILELELQLELLWVSKSLNRICDLLRLWDLFMGDPECLLAGAKLGIDADEFCIKKGDLKMDLFSLSSLLLLLL